MTQLARGVVAYAQDWDEHFPPADKWGDFISKRPELAGNSNLFKCPAADSRFGYGFNRALDRIAMEDITAPATVVMLFEMNSDTRNGSGGVAEAIRSGRHSFSANIGYADGHVRHANEHVQSDAVWDERSTGRK
jgi:prepilin-type processing-associated H-X9-DG protein